MAKPIEPADFLISEAISKRKPKANQPPSLEEFEKWVKVMQARPQPDNFSILINAPEILASVEAFKAYNESLNSL